MNRDAYIEQLFGKDDEILQKVRERIAEADMPMISIAPEWGKWLTMLVQMVQAKRVMEIGALGGYSGICLARGLADGGTLLSLEIEQKYADFAKESLGLAGMDHLVEYRVGHALDTLPALSRENQRFDLIFIDADKGNYPNYLEWAITLSHEGSIIVADNVMLHDRILDSADQGESAVAMRHFNEKIANDPRLDGIILPFRDGLAVARVK